MDSLWLLYAIGYCSLVSNHHQTLVNQTSNHTWPLSTSIKMHQNHQTPLILLTRHKQRRCLQQSNLSSEVGCAIMKYRRCVCVCEIFSSTNHWVSPVDNNKQAFWIHNHQQCWQNVEFYCISVCLASIINILYVWPHHVFAGSSQTPTSIWSSQPTGSAAKNQQVHKCS